MSYADLGGNLDNLKNAYDAFLALKEDTVFNDLMVDDKSSINKVSSKISELETNFKGYVDAIIEQAKIMEDNSPWD